MLSCVARDNVNARAEYCVCCKALNTGIALIPVRSAEPATILILARGPAAILIHAREQLAHLSYLNKRLGASLHNTFWEMSGFGI